MFPPNDPVQLTEEDLTTLKKCRQLSFWRGSVPFTIGAGLAVTVADRYGFFTKRRMLRIPCYVISMTVGYFLGKVSYIGECKRMFLQLNDSRIKDQILRVEQFTQSGGTFQPTPDSPIIVNTPVEKHPPMSYAQRREYYRHHPEQSGSSPSYSNSKPPEMGIDESKQQSETKSNLQYFDKDRPISSFYYDDDYRPKE
uniref:OCIA domain-containing protein n=1 Tax=Trichobilharzia regenti TaxID=157069 RepID=A0AA85KL32_TRIRE|nr:unnamed protein product [Trichobilharzia regenti]CAH8853428.1 unnamed protein product [Trichobilharzia regenti]